MRPQLLLRIATVLLLQVSVPVYAETQSGAPIPDIHQLLQQVQDHQKQLEKQREAFTYSSLQTVQDIDSNGRVTKTEVTETETFYVNGHRIERTVKKNGQPLSQHDDQKETERVTKLIEKAEKTPSSQPLEGQTISVSRVLEIMDVTNPRREAYHGRATLLFDFIGRKDAKTHDIAESASKKLKGAIWIDEADREVAYMEVTFDDNFHVGGGLVANVQKGSNFHFEQAPVDGQLWLPTGGEGTIEARVLLLKNMHQHFIERDYDYKRFRVDAESAKDAKVVGDKH